MYEVEHHCSNENLDMPWNEARLEVHGSSWHASLEQLHVELNSEHSHYHATHAYMWDSHVPSLSHKDDDDAYSWRN